MLGITYSMVGAFAAFSLFFFSFPFLSFPLVSVKPSTLSQREEDVRYGRG